SASPLAVRSHPGRRQPVRAAAHRACRNAAIDRRAGASRRDLQPAARRIGRRPRSPCGPPPRGPPGAREALADVHRMLGRALFVTGDSAGAEAQFAAAAELGLDGADPSPGIEALLDHATACGPAGPTPRAVENATGARNRSESAGPDLRRRAESTWGLVTFLS